MSAAAMARACILWSAGWMAYAGTSAFTEPDPLLALVHAACGLAHAILLVLSFGLLASDRRLRAAVAAHRRVDRARLRALAWLGVWSDRIVIDGPCTRTRSAHLGAVQAAACHEVAVAELGFLP